MYRPYGLCAALFFTPGDGMEQTTKQKYLSAAALLLVATAAVKVIGAVYKIPLTGFIGATGRGYFSTAYTLFMPVHAITLGAFPIALSGLVSKYRATGDSARVAALQRSARGLFFWVGLAGTALMVLLSGPYTRLVAGAPKAIYTVLILAPTAFFSAMAAARRAFAEGHLNMVPTSVCQVLEALFKMVFGLLFAKLSMGRLFQTYLDTGMVLGNRAESETAALSMMYPVTAACAMLGVTLGALAAWAYAALYDRLRYPRRLPRQQLPGGVTRELVQFSLPLVGATVIQSLSGFADTASVQMCLGLCGAGQLQQIFAVPLSLTKVAEKDVATYVYGLYSAVQDFVHLVPSLTMALGVAAVPALSGAYQDQSARFGSLYAGILKYTVILGAAGSGGLALFSYEVLSVFYGTSSPDLVLGCHRLLFWFAFTALPAALSSTCVFALQALGYAKRLLLPFTLAAVVRVGLNFLLIPNGQFHLYGSAIATGVSFLFLSVYCLVLMRRITKAKFSWIRVFVKPVLAVIFTCLTVKGVAGVFFIQLQNTWNFVLSAVLFSAVLTILLLFFGTLSTKDLHFARER